MYKIKIIYHVDFEKREGCGVVARESHEIHMWPHVTKGRTVSKSETTKNNPAFQDLNGRLTFVIVKLLR